MSHWMAVCALLVVQVTFVSLIAAIAYHWTARRHPVAARWFLGIAMLLVLGLTVTAVVPLPESWSVKRWLPDHAGRPSAVDSLPRDSAGLENQPRVAATLSMHITDAVSLAERILNASQVTAESTDSIGTWAFSVASLIVACGVIVCIRVALAIRATRRLIGRSSRVRDVAILELAEEIRLSIGCRPVELRASEEIAGAGTVGWRRPLLLVAANWREWSDGERRAVLAHEIAHVRANDYLTGLVARLIAAFHFYHPLVRWLASAFFLAQEAAADAVAARQVGGRVNYLVALSRIALRQDPRPDALSMTAFASSSSTLLTRRIEMLEFTDERPTRWRRLLQQTAVVVVCLSAVTASAIRLPAQDGRALTGQDARTVGNEGSERGLPSRVETPNTGDVRPPIDLRYVGDWHGFVAVRPETVLGQPRLRATARRFDDMLRSYLRSLDYPDEGSFSFADVEQAVGPINLKFLPDAPQGERHALQIGLSMFRTTKASVWQEFLQAIDPEAKESSRNEAKVLETVRAPIPPLFPTRSFALPDTRTVVPCSPDNGEDVPQPRKAPLPPETWAGDWALVQHSSLAFVLDKACGDWHQGFEGDTDSRVLEHPRQSSREEYMGCVASNLQYLVGGIDWQGESLTLQLTVKLQSSEASTHLAAGIPEVVDQIRNSVKSAKNRPGKVLRSVVVDLLDDLEVRRSGSTVQITGTTKLAPDQVATCLALAFPLKGA